MKNTAFDAIPRSAQGHFRLNYYAAVYCLLHQIQCLGRVKGDDTEEAFEAYPFLARYLEEILPFLPQDLGWDEGFAWWEEQLTHWEQEAARLPLTALKQECGLGFHSRMALMLSGLIEEDSRFGTLFAELQSPLSYRRPGLELVGRLAAGLGDQDGWRICRPLLSAGLLEAANSEAPRSEWILRVPPLIWDALRGESGDRPASGYSLYHPEEFSQLSQLIFPPDFHTRLQQLPALLRGGKARSLVLRGTPGNEPLQLMGAVARTLGRGVAVVELENSTQEAANHYKSLGAFCTLTGALPVFSCQPGPGETVTIPPSGNLLRPPLPNCQLPTANCQLDPKLQASGSRLQVPENPDLGAWTSDFGPSLLPGYSGPIGILLGLEGGLDGPGTEQALALTLPITATIHPCDRVRSPWLSIRQQDS